MELRIENAYYQPGASRQGLEGFLGTEIAQYEVMTNGLHLLSFQSMKDRPATDVPVQHLISLLQTRHPYYRFYYEVFFKDRTHSHGSVLLGANSLEELDRLSAELADGGTICNANPGQCTVFPQACSVSIEMEILVNGRRQSVIWGTTLEGLLTGPPRNIEVQRLYGGRLTPIKINPRDPKTLQLPLLPGDHVGWK